MSKKTYEQRQKEERKEAEVMDPKEELVEEEDQEEEEDLEEEEEEPEPEKPKKKKKAAPQMTKSEGFFVRNAEKLDKWTGRAIKIGGAVVAGGLLFFAGACLTKGKQTEENVEEVVTEEAETE